MLIKLILTIRRYKKADKITLGVVSGILSELVMTTLDWVDLIFKLDKWHIFHIAASTYFKIEDVKTLPALFVGAITHFASVGMLGAVTCYILYYTGTDFYWLKRIGSSMMFWLVAYGVILRANIGKITPTDASTNIFHILAHIGRGWLVTYLIIKLAKERVLER